MNLKSVLRTESLFNLRSSKTTPQVVNIQDKATALSSILNQMKLSCPKGHLGLVIPYSDPNVLQTNESELNFCWFLKDGKLLDMHYTSTHGRLLVESQSKQGSCYAPTADDIGKHIILQCSDILGLGLSRTIEAGPIEPDSLLIDNMDSTLTSGCYHLYKVQVGMTMKTQNMLQNHLILNNINNCNNDNNSNNMSNIHEIYRSISDSNDINSMINHNNNNNNNLELNKSSSLFNSRDTTTLLHNNTDTHISMTISTGDNLINHQSQRAIDISCTGTVEMDLYCNVYIHSKGIYIQEALKDSVTPMLDSNTRISNNTSSPPEMGSGLYIPSLAWDVRVYCLQPTSLLLIVPIYQIPFDLAVTPDPHSTESTSTSSTSFVDSKPIEWIGYKTGSLYKQLQPLFHQLQTDINNSSSNNNIDNIVSEPPVSNPLGSSPRPPSASNPSVTMMSLPPPSPTPQPIRELRLVISCKDRLVRDTTVLTIRALSGMKRPLAGAVTGQDTLNGEGLGGREDGDDQVGRRLCWLPWSTKLSSLCNPETEPRSRRLLALYEQLVDRARGISHRTLPSQIRTVTGNDVHPVKGKEGDASRGEIDRQLQVEFAVEDERYRQGQLEHENAILRHKCAELQLQFLEIQTTITTTTTASSTSIGIPQLISHQNHANDDDDNNGNNLKFKFQFSKCQLSFEVLKSLETFQEISRQREIIQLQRHLINEFILLLLSYQSDCEKLEKQYDIIFQQLTIYHHNVQDVMIEKEHFHNMYKVIADWRRDSIEKHTTSQKLIAANQQIDLLKEENQQLLEQIQKGKNNIPEKYMETSAVTVEGSTSVESSDVFLTAVTKDRNLLEQKLLEALPKLSQNEWLQKQLDESLSLRALSTATASTNSTVTSQDAGAKGKTDTVSEELKRLRNWNSRLLKERQEERLQVAKLEATITTLQQSYDILVNEVKTQLEMRPVSVIGTDDGKDGAKIEGDVQRQIQDQVVVEVEAVVAAEDLPKDPSASSEEVSRLEETIRQLQDMLSTSQIELEKSMKFEEAYLSLEIRTLNAEHIIAEYESNQQLLANQNQQYLEQISCLEMEKGQLMSKLNELQIECMQAVTVIASQQTQLEERRSVTASKDNSLNFLNSGSDGIGLIKPSMMTGNEDDIDVSTRTTYSAYTDHNSLDDSSTHTTLTQPSFSSSTTLLAPNTISAQTKSEVGRLQHIMLSKLTEMQNQSQLLDTLQLELQHMKHLYQHEKEERYKLSLDNSKLETIIWTLKKDRGLAGMKEPVPPCGPSNICMERPIQDTAVLATPLRGSTLSSSSSSSSANNLNKNKSPTSGSGDKDSKASGSSKKVYSSGGSGVGSGSGGNRTSEGKNSSSHSISSKSRNENGNRNVISPSFIKANEEVSHTLPRLPNIRTPDRRESLSPTAHPHSRTPPHRRSTASAMTPQDSMRRPMSASAIHFSPTGASATGLTIRKPLPLRLNMHPTEEGQEGGGDEESDNDGEEESSDVEGESSEDSNEEDSSEESDGEEEDGSSGSGSGSEEGSQSCSSVNSSSQESSPEHQHHRNRKMITGIKFANLDRFDSSDSSAKGSITLEKKKFLMILKERQTLEEKLITTLEELEAYKKGSTNMKLILQKTKKEMAIIMNKWSYLMNHIELMNNKKLQGDVAIKTISSQILTLGETNRFTECELIEIKEKLHIIEQENEALSTEKEKILHHTSEEINGLLSENRTLKHELTELQCEFEVNKSTHKDLVRRHQETLKMYEEIHKKFQEAKSIILELKNQNDGFKERLQASEATVLNLQNNAYDGKSAPSEESLDSARNEERVWYEGRIRELEGEIIRLRGIISSSMTGNNTTSKSASNNSSNSSNSTGLGLQQELERCQKELQDVQNKLLLADKEVSRSNKECVGLRKECTRLKETIATVQRNKEPVLQMKKDMEQLQNQYTEVTALLTQVQQENSHLKYQLENVNYKSSKEDGNYSSHEAHKQATGTVSNETLKNQIAQLKAQLIDANQANQAMNALMNENSDTIDRLRTEKDQLNHNLNTIADDLTNTHQLYTQTQHKLAELEAEKVKSERERNGLRKECTRLKETIARAQEDREALGKLRPLHKDLENQKIILEKTIQEYQVTMERLTEEIRLKIETISLQDNQINELDEVLLRTIQLSDRLGFESEDLRGCVLRLDEESKLHLEKIDWLNIELKEAQAADPLIVQDLQNKLADMIGSKNHWESKANSLSKDLQRRLLAGTPLQRELGRLTARLEEVENERNAYRDAMVMACDQFCSTKILMPTWFG